MPPRSPMLQVMVAAAQKAGRAILRDFGEVEQLQVSKKGPADFVSTADRKAERIVVQELQKARPRFGMLLEESGEIAGEDSSNRWIVDPLDGTTNFLHGIPHFAVSIAHERDGQLQAGVVYSPVPDETFAAERGTGAFLNDRRLRVSGRVRMEEALFATGIPFHGEDKHPYFLAQMEAVMQRSAGIRRFGSAALDLAWVAAGRYDGFWESGLNPWDIAAGIVLVREAGGMVTDFGGRDRMIATGEVMAANASLDGELMKTLREATKAAKAAAG